MGKKSQNILQYEYMIPTMWGVGTEEHYLWGLNGEYKVDLFTSLSGGAYSVVVV